MAGYYTVEDTPDSKLVAEPLKGLADELGPIIIDNSSWHAKAINDVMFNKFDHVRYLYFPQRDSFSPFREVISYGFRMNRCPMDEGEKHLERGVNRCKC